MIKTRLSRGPRSGASPLSVLFFTGYLLAVSGTAQPPIPDPVAQPANQQAGHQDEAAKVDSDEDLRRAIQESSGNESQLIVNLEGYLRQWPRSQRRTEILEEIYKLALKLRDQGRILDYGVKLIEGDPGSVDVLATLVATLRERRQAGDLERAKTFAHQLVREFESLVTDRPKPRRLSAAQWEEQKREGLASVYLTRGRVLADLEEQEAAVRDLQYSSQLAPQAMTSLLLANLAEKRREPAPAASEILGHLRQAFLLSLVEGSKEVDALALRRRIRTVYLTQHSTEAGLGDQLLVDLDSYLERQAERTAQLERPNPNAEAIATNDLLAFRLSRPEGTALDLASLRGKVLVLNFWATWCGPCRTELPLFQKTIERYRDDSQVAFLAVTTDEDRGLVTPYLQQNGHQLPVVFADGLDQLFAITAIPTTIIVDAAGKVHFRLRGYNPRDDFVALLQQRIEEAKASLPSQP
jgi:thiol-disulfide isomerase/thioredoxin